MAIRLLHIINDEKFTNGAIKQFSAFDNPINYFLIPKNSKSELTFTNLDNIQSERVFLCSYQNKDLVNVIFRINPSAIVVHGLSNEHKKIIDALGGRFTFVLNSWGSDIYDSKYLCATRFKPETRRVLNANLAQRTKLVIKTILRYLTRSAEFYKFKDIDFYLSKVSIISTVVYEDFVNLKCAYPDINNLQYVPFNYFIELSGKLLEANRSNGVLLGNSANPQNNHLDLFSLLKRRGLSTQRVMVPLSYGGSDHYKDKVLRRGYEIFGRQNFIAITDFMKPEEYNLLLDKVGFAFFYHGYQQAFGNILSLLSRGVKIFMDPSNSACKELLKIGFKVFDIRDVNVDSLIPLPFEEQKYNFDLVHKFYGKEANELKVNKFLDTISRAVSS